MTTHSGVVPAKQDRLPTGAAGLDDVLLGGLIRRGGTLVVGSPGTGKTTLGNQLAFSCARAGETVIFATALAETHDRMIANLAGFSFFDRAMVGERIYYVSLYDELRERGLSGALKLIWQLVRQHHASMVVIDGASRFADFAPTEDAYRHFTADLFAQLGTLGCTSILLANPVGDLLEAVATHADALIVLSRERVRVRDVRLLNVHKLRGAPYLMGMHAYAITDDGLNVYPRLEAARPASPPALNAQRAYLPLGVDGLDEMLGGGLLSGATSLVIGTPGAGKTTVGLHFLAKGAERGERGLIATFHESPERLIAKAESLGLNLRSHVESGLVRVLWYPSLELLLDAWAHQVLGAIEAHGSQRVFIDTLSDAQSLAAFPDRLPAFTAAFTRALEAQEVTTVLAAELRAIVTNELELPVQTLSATLENTLLLRYVEIGSRLRRFVSVLKGERGTDPRLREFTISNEGMVVSAEQETMEDILTGRAHTRQPRAERPRRAQFRRRVDTGMEAG